MSKAHAHNAGQRVVEWLYSKQLQVDAKWAVQTGQGFKWWPYDRHQTVEVIGEKHDNEAGLTAQFVSIRTPIATDIELSDINLAAISSAIMHFATMAGPVYDEKEKTLGLCSLVPVHDDVEEQMGMFLSLASLLQLDAANALGKVFGDAGNGVNALSHHPTSGVREVPDEMTNAVQAVLIPAGKEPVRWPKKEFTDVVDDYMQTPPSLMATSGQGSLTVEFPYGEHSSLCRMTTKDAHPRYGNGLLFVQSFAFPTMTPTQGTKLALVLNAQELNAEPSGYGLGSFYYDDDTMKFVSFFPNVSYRPGFLPILYFTAASRAEQIANAFAGR